MRRRRKFKTRDSDMDDIMNSIREGALGGDRLAQIAFILMLMVAAATEKESA